LGRFHLTLREQCQYQVTPHIAHQRRIRAHAWQSKNSLQRRERFGRFALRELDLRKCVEIAAQQSFGVAAFRFGNCSFANGARFVIVLQRKQNVRTRIIRVRDTDAITHLLF
jgi:hypothetical protein